MKKNHVSHFEIYADDTAKLQQFYSGLFDWHFQKMGEMDYTLVHSVETDSNGRASQPGGINGGMLKRPSGFTPKAWVNYVTVDSIETTVAKAKKLGAHVSKPKSPVPGMGSYAMLTDPQGNEFALWQTDADAK